MTKLGIVLLAGVAGIGFVSAQSVPVAKRPMTFADLMAMKRVSDPQVSPSGKWVMFSVTDVSLQANTKVNHLWVVAIDGSSPEHQVTFGDGETNGRFSPDAKYVSIEQKGQIYLAGWDEAQGKPGPARQLTSVSTEASGALWSPDAGRLLFVSSVYPECSDLGDFTAEDACDQRRDAEAAKSQVKAQLWTSLLYRHWNAYTGFKRSHIFAVSVTSGKDVRDLTPKSVVGDAETPTFSLGGPLGYAWAPGSREIAYVTNLDKVPAASTNNDVFTLRLDDPGAKAIKVSTSPGSDDGPQYSPDGKWLAFRSQARAGYESDRFRLALLDRQSGAPQYMLQTPVAGHGGMPGAPALDLWIDEFTWVPNSKLIYFVSNENGEAPVFRINLEGDDFHRLGKITGEWSSIVVDPKTYNLVGSLMLANRPAEIALGNQLEMDDTARHFTLSLAGGATAKDITQPEYKPTWLSHQNGNLLEELDLPALQFFTFAGAAATKVQGFIVKPPNFNPSKKYPVKFLIHGGPQGAWGDAWSYRWNPELMAASGYVVVMVNPRGSTGYGQAFIDGVNGDWGGKPYQDLMLGLDAAEKQFPFIDKTRECALGASYGGFMANWILTHTDRFKCIVTHDGMFNPVSAYGTTEELWFNEWEFRRTMPNGKLDPEPAQPWRYASLPEDQDPFRKFSPLLHIQNAKTPTLVIHGQKDYRLDVSEGLQLFDSLQRLNVPSEMLYFPDEGHWVQKPQNSELWNKTVSDWCDRWTHSNAYAGK